MNLNRRIPPWFRLPTEREPQEAELTAAARQTRLAMKGIWFCRLDEPSPPRGRKARKRDLLIVPVATIAFYGPDDDRAGKVVASVQAGFGSGEPLERWNSSDVLDDARVLEEMPTGLGDHTFLYIPAGTKLHRPGLDGITKRAEGSTFSVH